MLGTEPLKCPPCKVAATSAIVTNVLSVRLIESFSFRFARKIRAAREMYLPPVLVESPTTMRELAESADHSSSSVSSGSTIDSGS